MANSMWIGNFTLQATGNTAVTATFGQLKSCAAKVVDGEGRAKILTRAGDYIKSCVLISEMGHLFRFARSQQSLITIVAADTTYGLASDYYAMSEVQLVDATTEKPKRKLRFINWNDFQMLEQNQDQTGDPVYYSFKNDFSDQEIEVYPAPTASTASTYKLRITYYKRLTEPSADADTIAAPKGFGEVLCAYGQYKIKQNQHPDQVAVWRDYKTEYLRLLDLFKQSVTRSKAGARQMRIAGARTLNPYPRAFDPLS